MPPMPAVTMLRVLRSDNKEELISAKVKSPKLSPRRRNRILVEHIAVEQCDIFAFFTFCTELKHLTVVYLG